MKLAEALLEKKALSARITELNSRFTASALLEEGESPEESAQDLLVSLQAAFARWEALTVSINQSNNTIMVGDMTMMQSLAHRDSLKIQIAHFNNIKEALRGRNENRRHYGENAPKLFVAANVNVSFFIKRVDDLSQELRILDSTIQASNWASDLV